MTQTAIPASATNMTAYTPTCGSLTPQKMQNVSSDPGYPLHDGQRRTSGTICPPHCVQN